MLEESVLGWKEYELEVMRDHADNVVIICSIENLDPMGVHTGDSITVAPAQTLTDREYQTMRDASLAIMREIGVDTGGSNVQFAVNPQNGDMIVVEMNPRVSRSSALASKATGFPIAKIAAKLAVGYTLDEIPNDITGETLASFEPTLDYCVVKIPRWTFEKFPETQDLLTTAMKSVGETMAIGRTFKEAFQKGLRSLEIGRFGFGADGKDRPEADGAPPSLDEIEQKLAIPNSQRLFYLRYALQAGMSIETIYQMTAIDPWFLFQLEQIFRMEQDLIQAAETAGRSGTPAADRLFPLTADQLTRAKAFGFSDVQIAHLIGSTEKVVERTRKDLGIRPVYKLVDTCAAEFRAATPYYYSTYETECEARVSDRKKVMILGGGPNRIGQGIEFDYCCVHASFALREMGVESIMVNSNPETVSTDYDTSDKLYFEPLTREDVLHIVEKEKPAGIIVQFGGQTPLNLSTPLHAGGRSHPGHPAGEHRPGRRPGAVSGHAEKAEPHAAGQRHGPVHRRGADDRRYHRLSGDRAPLLRPGRAGHEDCLRSQGYGDVYPAGHPGLPGSPGAHRQVSGSGHGGGCGRRFVTVPAPLSAASWNISRRPGSTAAIPPACCPPTASAAT